MISLSTVENLVHPNLFESRDQLFHVGKFVGGHGQQQEPITTSQRLNLLYILEAAVRRWWVDDVVKDSRKIRDFLCVLSQQTFPGQKSLHLHWFWYDLGVASKVYRYFVIVTPRLKSWGGTTYDWNASRRADDEVRTCRPSEKDMAATRMNEATRGKGLSQLYQLGQFHGFQNFQSWDLIILEVVFPFEFLWTKPPISLWLWFFVIVVSALFCQVFTPWTCHCSQIYVLYILFLWILTTSISLNIQTKTKQTTVFRPQTATVSKRLEYFWSKDTVAV